MSREDKEGGGLPVESSIARVVGRDIPGFPMTLEIVIIEFKLASQARQPAILMG